MEILGKGPSLNHPEDLEVTERTSRKWVGEKLPINTNCKASFKSLHIEVLIGSGSRCLYFLSSGRIITCGFSTPQAVVFSVSIPYHQLLRSTVYTAPPHSLPTALAVS